MCLEVVPKATSQKRNASIWKTDAKLFKRAATKAAVADEAGKHEGSHGRQKAGCMKVGANLEV